MSTPASTPQEHAITWTTNYRGHTYELAPDGRLLHLQQTPRPPQEQEASMTEPLDPAYTTRIPGIPDPEPTITRIISEELHALALRREARRRAQEDRR